LIIVIVYDANHYQLTSEFRIRARSYFIRWIRLPDKIRSDIPALADRDRARSCGRGRHRGRCRSPARVEKFFPPQQPVKREMAPRAKRQITKAPAPTPKASEVIAAPAVADSPLENAPESAPPQPESAMTAAATPALIETTQARFDANYLRNPAPAYPAMSRRLGEEGRVVLRVFVDIDGRPEQVELKNSSGFPRLDQAAEDAVRRWKFVPAKRGEEAVATWVAVPIVFNLKTS
jgi:protein TonB